MTYGIVHIMVYDKRGNFYWISFEIMTIEDPNENMNFIT